MKFKLTNKSVRSWRLLVLTGVLTLFCQCANAATYYVATTGSDSNPGTASAPFRHLSKGAAAATNPGDTVIVMDGTYDNEGQISPNYVVTLNYSGGAGNPITFKAQNRGKAVLDSMNTATGTTCDGAFAYFNLHNAAFIVIQGFVIQRGCHEGIHSNDSAHDITIRWNEIKNIANHTQTDQIGQDGIYLNNTEYNFIFDGNLFHDIGRTDGQTLLHFDHGIYSHAQNMTIINNIFYNPNSSAITRYAATISGSAFDHNLVYGVSTVILDVTGFTIGLNQIAANPLLVNASTAPYDFHAQSGGAGIDAGVNLSAVLSDFDGVTRPQGPSTDVGAYEYPVVLVVMPPTIVSITVF